MALALNELLSMAYGVLAQGRKLALAVLLLPSTALAEGVTIAALGDSLTHGFGLPTEDGFVPQMQAWLDAQGQEVTLINAGVSGETTAGGLSRVAWTLTPEVDAMIVALGANDFLRGIGPEVVRENLRGILEVAEAQGVEVMLVGLDVGANYGSEYKAQFDVIYPELAQEFGAVIFPSWFKGLEGAAPSIAEMRGFFQADMTHPNAEGVTLIVDAMGPTVIELIEKVNDPAS